MDGFVAYSKDHETKRKKYLLGNPVNGKRTDVPMEARRPLWQQAASSCLGATCTAIAVTPLDMIKTRLQAQALGPLNPQAVSRDCSHKVCGSLKPGTMEWFDTFCKFPKCHEFETCFCDAHGLKPPLKGTLDAMQKIVHFEGSLALWNGLRPTLVLQIPNTVVYLGAYEELRRQLRQMLSENQLWTAPALAGMMARTVAAASVAPLELVRTRRQAALQWPHKTVLAALRAIYRHEGSGTFFRGLGPTMLRDVPFSGIYWFGIEEISTRMRLNPPSRMLRLGDAALFDAWAIGLTAGVSSGSFAALITTPFDVVKTRMQLDNCKGDECGFRHTAMRILRQHGPSGMFVGVVPRVTKVAPACAIMISIFELAKATFAS